MAPPCSDGSMLFTDNVAQAVSFYAATLHTRPYLYPPRTTATMAASCSTPALRTVSMAYTHYAAQAVSSLRRLCK